jgi:methionyl-tRNA formyltransferase
MKKRFVLAGNEKIGYECLKILLQENQEVLGVVTDSGSNKRRLENARIKFLANQAGIRVYELDDINNVHFLEELRLSSPDVIFNIAFLQLYRAPLLAIPRLGCINFHPGPLPRYGGSNAWVWAIINGESKYGVTFHYMEEKIDAGAIIGLEEFPILKDDTGLSLLIKCYEHGAALFRQVLRDILNDTVVPVSQDLTKRSYYYHKIPYEGIIDTRWNATRLCDFVRAMTFSPFPNPLSPPMVAFKGARLVVTKAKILGAGQTGESHPGEVLDISQEGVVMQTGNGIVLLSLSDRSMPSFNTKAICNSRGIEKGAILGG